MTDPLRDHDPRLEEWERLHKYYVSEATRLLIPRVRALERERDEYERNVNTVCDERDAAEKERDEARAVAREFRQELRHIDWTMRGFPGLAAVCRAFDALSWAKD